MTTANTLYVTLMLLCKKRFLQFCFQICYLSGLGIKSVLAFMTGSTVMPKEINIRFLPDSNSYTLPDPDTCTNTVKIPTCHTSYEQFESAFDATVRIQGKGYGRA